MHANWQCTTRSKIFHSSEMKGPHPFDPQLNRQNSHLRNQGKKDNVERLIYTFAQDLSVIGFRYCFDKSRSWLRRVSWGVFVLFGVGLAFYQIIDRASFFFSYPTSTEINVVQATQLDFPQVTICNENMIRKSVAAKLGRLLLRNWFIQ